jgi:TonB family protein
LLSTLIIGLLLPLDWARLWVGSHESLDSSVVYLQPFVVGSKIASGQIQRWKIDFNYWLSMIYIIGVCFLLMRFMVGIYRLNYIFRKAEKIKYQNYILIKTGVKHLPFSFFQYIFWGDFSERDANAQQLILSHEIAHVEQKHSIDVLLLEILNIVFWCSPIIYSYKKSLKAVHEYLADEAVTALCSKKEYGTVLLRQVSSGSSPALVHPFHSQLKLRFAMLLKRNSSRWAYLKYALCIPTVLIINVLLQAQTDTDLPTITIDPVGGTKITTYKELRILDITDTVTTFDPVTFEEKVTIVKATDSIYLKPDKPAEFKGGQEELFKLLAATIKYPKEAKDKGIEGKNVIQFTVLKDGFISVATAKIRKSSGNKLLDEETSRLILALQYNESESKKPYWIPGEKNGKPVATDFLLPISYKLEDKDKLKLPDKQ